MMGQEPLEYFPARFLSNVAHPEIQDHAPDLLILNQPISHFDTFARLWKQTSYRLCADGGANRLFDMFESGIEDQREKYVSEKPTGLRITTEFSSCPASSMAILTRCAMMCGPIMQRMGLKYRTILIKTVQTSARPCRKFRLAPHLTLAKTSSC